MDRILVTEQIAEEGLAALGAAAEVDVRTDLDRAALIAALPSYDGLIVRSATKVTADVLAAGERLRVVGRAGTGVDNIDVDAATQRGILVVNAPAALSVAAAEMAIGLIFAVARRIPHAHASVQGGAWERGAFMGAVLGVPTLKYLPYCFFNIASPFLSVMYGFTGFKITRARTREGATQAHD